MRKKTAKVPKRLSRRIEMLEKELFLAFSDVAIDLCKQKKLSLFEYVSLVHLMMLQHIKQFVDMTLEVLPTAVEECVEARAR